MDIRRRLRDLGFRFPGLHAPGPWNAITDVPGVAVGHATLTVAGDPAAQTGVTAVLPHGGDPFEAKYPAAVWPLNGSGECTGDLQINEWGVLETPILLTGTPSVGRVYDGCIDWLLAHSPRLAAGRAWVIPCVAECFDGWLNDAGRHRAGRAEVEAALAAAASGPVAEGAVGGGRGMICYQFKGGIGTASRRVAGRGWAVGALVMANFGRREELTLAGVRLGAELRDAPGPAWGAGERSPGGGGSRDGGGDGLAIGADGGGGAGLGGGAGDGADDGGGARLGDGSCIVVLATDAPLQNPGLLRLCKRGALGLGRTGSAAHHGSGEILIAFSTAGSTAHDAVERGGPEVWGSATAGLFQAAAEAVEEAVWNALFMAADVTGRQGRSVAALPAGEAVARLRSVRPDLFSG